MDTADLFPIARALHVFGVVLWIGGVAFVTTVLIPSLKRLESSDDKLELFERLEGRFAFQARITTFLTGLSGFYMVEVMDAWNRFLQVQYWWMHLMTLIWLVFTVVLFLLEPLFLHRWFHEMAVKDSRRAFIILHRLHIVLLVLSLITLLGAVAGAHGSHLFG
ncbi:MAG: hypothetical protein DRP71_01645 [Verrucomicrobia bacterium]|nr:MAG: hypothetical protein DRP71_01645 [Verrucomicrobiota bacterium]